MYVLAEITFFPQKAWVVSSATCTEGLFAAPHTVCRPSYATLCLSRGATRCEWQGALPITLPLILPLFLIVVFFFKPLSVLFFLSLEIKRLQGAPHCLCSTFQQSIFFGWKEWIAAGMQHSSPSGVWRLVRRRGGWYVLCCQRASCMLCLILMHSRGLYF